MTDYAVRRASSDTTLDYLFQMSIEDQFASLRAAQKAPAPPANVVTRITNWFKNIQQQPDPYENYLPVEE